MSIYSMKIKNYKTILDSEISFKGNLSGIYGPNGTGKTAILEVFWIIKNYFLSTFENEKTDELKKKIMEGISIGKNIMEIEIIFSLQDTLYKLGVDFKVENRNVSVLKEEFSSKKREERKKFKNIFRVFNDEHDLLPKIYFANSTKDDSEFLNGLNISRKNILVEFNNFYSYMALLSKNINKDTLDVKNIETKYLTHLVDFLSQFFIMIGTLQKAIIVSLKEQALYNLGILIPLNFHTEKAHGVIGLNLETESNIYAEEIADTIETVVHQIDSIFSVIVPDSRLMITKEIATITEKEKKMAINLYVEREGKRISLKKESTGIIKLVSLLSAMIYYVQDEGAIVAIDELDIHIFEYLLAMLLEKLSQYAKGQLIFTAHNLLPMEKLQKDSIIISTRNDKHDIEYTYLKGISKTTNLRQKYLKSQRMWSEENIEPLLLNTSALDMYIKKLVME
ncbi:MAG TPA: AAA family ATPase [Fusobacterium sp.]